MNSRSVALCFGALFMILGQAIAGDNPQSEAETLLDRARQLSDIRKPNAPAFRLKATFSFVDDNLESVEGTYTELWVSDSQWRREIVVKDLREIQVAGATRMWVLEGDKPLPEQAARVLSVVEIFPPKTAKFEFESVGNRTSDDASAKCAITKPSGQQKAKHAFCFDQKEGVLIETHTPSLIRERSADYSCAYDHFRKLGGQWFPHEMVCGIDGHRQLEVHIAEITTQTFNEPALFTPPDGAVEIRRCLAGVTAPPKALSTPDPMFPMGSRNQNSAVTLQLVVDVKGKPENVRVVRSGGKSFDEEAVGAVRRWRFKPATCDGEPMPVQIEVIVDFRLFR